MVNELRATDLRFSQQEAEIFLAQTVGVDASEQLAAPLWERVEGWIAGLRLASLSLRAAPNAIELAQRFTRGRNRYVMDYLFEQVFQRQTPSMQHFLMKTSILDRLSPALAQAVMAEDTQPSSKIDLVALEQAGLFLTALDDTDEWFQYHALFRELLYQTLQHTCTPEEVAALHRRASLWFRANHQVDEALRHALTAGDTELTAQIVAEHVVDQLNRFDWHPLQRWLTQLPVDVIEMHPWLLVAKAFVLHNRSQWNAMRPILKRAEQRVNAPDEPINSAERVLLRAYLDGLWSVHWIASDEAELAKEAAQKSLQNLPPRSVQPAEDHEFISLEEIRRIAALPIESGDLARQRDRAAAVMLFLSGMRAGAFSTLPIAAVDPASRTVKQWPSLGVETKNGKSATTYLLEIPELLQVIEQWDAVVRSQLPENAMWYTPVISHWGEQTLSPEPPGQNRSIAVTKRIRKLLTEAGLPYRSPHKFRHGHAVYALQHAKTMADYKAVSMNLMHNDIRVTDGIYAPLAGNEVQRRIAGLTGQAAPQVSADGDLTALIDNLPREQLSAVLIAIAQKMSV